MGTVTLTNDNEPIGKLGQIDYEFRSSAFLKVAPKSKGTLLPGESVHHVAHR